MKRMKKFAFLVSVPLMLGTVVFTNKSKTTLVEVYNASSLPTTIDLNDYSDNAIREYYS